MELNVFAGQEKSELSMIEVARAILEERGRGNEIYFNDLVNEIQNYLEKSNSEIRAALPIFYSDLNVDGSFIPLGDNKWGLRSWYAIDEIDEEVVALDELDDDGERPVKKRKKVNAFAADGVDIDYSDDDPEDDDALDDEDVTYDDENPDDEKDEAEAFDAELEEVDLDVETVDGLEDEDDDEDDEED